MDNLIDVMIVGLIPFVLLLHAIFLMWLCDRIERRVKHHGNRE